MQIDNALAELVSIMNEHKTYEDARAVRAGLARLGDAIDSIGGAILFTTLAESLGNDTIELAEFMIAAHQLQIAGQSLKKASRLIGGVS